MEYQDHFRPAPTVTLTEEEKAKLSDFSRRVDPLSHVFSTAELARMRFIRWLLSPDVKQQVTS